MDAECQDSHRFHLLSGTWQVNGRGASLETLKKTRFAVPTHALRFVWPSASDPTVYRRLKFITGDVVTVDEICSLLHNYFLLAYTRTCNEFRLIDAPDMPSVDVFMLVQNIEVRQMYSLKNKKRLDVLRFDTTSMLDDDEPYEPALGCDMLRSAWPCTPANVVGRFFHSNMRRDAGTEAESAEYAGCGGLES